MARPPDLPSWLSPREGGVDIEVLAVPRASMTELSGVHEGRLKIRLAAPPVEGKANKELAKWLAKRLGVPRSAVKVAAGKKGRRKLIRVQGVDARDALGRLGWTETQPERGGNVDG